MTKKIFGMLVLLVLCSTGYAQSSKDFFDRALIKYRLEDYAGAIQDYNEGIDFARINQYPSNKKSQANPLYDKTLAAAYLKRGLCKIKLKDKKGACIDINKAADMGDRKAYKEKEKYCDK
ncbi:MAG: hypothetical protein WCL56_12890 [Sediminibacterium sp.]